MRVDDENIHTAKYQQQSENNRNNNQKYIHNLNYFIMEFNLNFIKIDLNRDKIINLLEMKLKNKNEKEQEFYIKCQTN